MNQPQRVLDLIYFGYYLERLHHPYGSQYATVASEIEQLIVISQRLGYSGFVDRLEKVSNELRSAHEQTPALFKDTSPLAHTGEILPNDFLTKIHQIINGMFGSLNEYAKTWEVIKIDRTVVSNTLRSLHTHATDIHQQVLVDETISCLECGSYRSAIVMGWNLALDHIRQWIFSSKKRRLQELNAALTRKSRTPSQIAIYEDFFDLSERVLIDDAYDAKLFKKNPYKFLVGALDTRNSFAHPSRMIATATTAAGYIDGLIRNVITNAHFAFKKRTIS